MMESENILDDYKLTFKADEIDSEIQQIIEKSTSDNEDVEVLKTIFSCIDLTTLKETDSAVSVTAFVQKVNQFKDKYPTLPSVGAVCVFPVFAPIIKQYLKVEGVQKAVVSGGFPSSQTFFRFKGFRNEKGH